MPAGICAPKRFMTMTRSKATTQALTVFSAVQRGAGAAAAAAAAPLEAPPKATRHSMARSRGLRLRGGVRRMPASLETLSPIDGCCAGKAACRAAPDAHKSHFIKTMIRIELPALPRKPLPPSWPAASGGRPAPEEGEAAHVLGALPHRLQVLLDQLLAVSLAGQQAPHRRREGGVKLPAPRRGDQQPGELVPIAEPPQELGVEERRQLRIAAHRRLRPAIGAHQLAAQGRPGGALLGTTDAVDAGQELRGADRLAQRL